MTARVPAPLAEVLVPEWGSVWPVVEVDGDRWTVECFGRRRELSTDQVELNHFLPTRNGIAATKGDRSTESGPLAEDVKGEPWRAWRSRRIQQIHNCRRMGWKVTGWKVPVEERKTEEKPPRPARTWFDASWQREYHGRGLAEKPATAPAPAPEPAPVDWSVVELEAGAVFGPTGSEAMLRLQHRHRTPNPKWATWQFLQKGREPDRTINPGGHFFHGPRKGSSWLPRGAMDWKADPMPEGPGRAVADGIRPFWYQSEAVEAVAAVGHGVVEAPCGAGKTGIGTFLAARIQRRVLVVCHTLELVRQWVERLSTWLPGTSVGQLGGGKKPKGDPEVVVASLATLARWDWDALEAFAVSFDLLICDECHHVPAETWIRVVCALPCRWRMGLTATPDRKDGLHTWMHLALGSTVYRIDQKTLDDSGRTMAPVIHVLETGHEVEVLDVPAHTMRGILEDEARNRLIQGAVSRLVQDGRTVLVLTGLVDHAEALARALEGEALVGKVTPKKREAVLARVRAGELRVVVATQLADEGLDLPMVDTVVLAAPSSHKPATRQRVGRACRALEGKRTPWVVDVKDNGDWALRKWSARKSLYRSLGWPISRWK